MGVTARGLAVPRGDFVLDIPSFTCAGRGTAVLGPNGSGKTTLLLALQGLIAASGSIERPQRIASVFARPAVLRGAALWNVAVVVQTALKLTERDAIRRAERAIDDVGLSERSQTDARDLSTGERQRLALARALACEPNALFLDEPFANIDADARPALRSLVRSYRERSNCDVVIATAALADAVALCDEVIVLSRGVPADSGPIEIIASSGDPYLRALLAESRIDPQRAKPGSG